MSLTVTQRPSTTISGNTSKWNAAKNPIVYKMIRKDFNITNVANSGGALQITVNTNLTTLTTAQGGPVVIGAKLYVDIDSGFGDGGYNRDVYTVVSVTNAASSVVTFGAGTFVSAAVTTGYINLMQRASYQVKARVWPINVLYPKVLGSLAYSCDKAGNVLIDVSTIVKSNADLDNISDYTLSGSIYTDTSTLYFYIDYQETWQNHANSITDDSANPFLAINGAKQIGEAYGGNLAEYVCYENATPLAKFLTKFTRPSIWRDYPFSLSLLLSQNLTTTNGFRVEYFDITGASISSISPTKNSNDSKAIRILPYKALAIPSNAATAQIRHEKTGIVVLSETITCVIKDPCSNPIHLYWRNSLGGDAFWMFDFNQNYSYRYDNGRKAERYVLFASNLTDNEFDAISELNTLGEVYDVAYTELTTSVNKSQARIGAQVYMMDATGKKTGVIVIPTEVSTNTKFSRNKIQITIELPEIY
jgi:hypothetical protein